jgi:hypothetical protein
MSNVPPLGDDSVAPPDPVVWPPAPSVSEPAAIPSVNVAVFQNTSGTDGPLPPEIARLKWNWGAFGLSGLWLLSHKRYVAGILALLAAIVVRVAGASAGPLIGLLAICALAYSVYLGLKGHRIAWKSRRFEGIEHYITVQQYWLNWALGLIIFSILGSVIEALVRSRPAP